MALTTTISPENQSSLGFIFLEKNENSRCSHVVFSTTMGFTPVVLNPKQNCDARKYLYVPLFFPFAPYSKLYRDLLLDFIRNPPVSKAWEDVIVICLLKYIHVQIQKKDHKLQTEPNEFPIVKWSLAKSCVTLLTLTSLNLNFLIC